jgi:AraC-like DNA-binding protein
MSTIEAGLRGGGIAVLLLIGLFAWRDARHLAAARYVVLYMVCGASYLVASAPEVMYSHVAWVLPLRVLSIITPAVFQLWASATFNDSFRPSWVAWLPTAAMAALAIWAIAANRWLPWRIVEAAALVLVAAGVWQVLGGRAGDLVEGRRRFRLILATAAAMAIAGITLFSALAGPQARAYASVVTVTITLVLAIGGAMLGLGMRMWSGLVNEPAAGVGNPTSPAAAAAIAIDPEERVLLDRLQRLMEEARIYREEGLSIASLAARLGLPEYRLRRLINQRLGHRNFTSFVNGYRLVETIAALSDSAQAQVPILTIALDAGFQSIGPFNRAFKAQTGMTPTDFRRERLEQTASQAAE